MIGIAALGDDASDFGRNFEFKEGVSPFFAVLSGAGLAFYALIGFEDSVNIAEEVEKPSKNYPRILFTGLAIAGVLYMAVTLVASAVVPTGVLANSSAPLVEVGQKGPLGVSPDVFAAITLFALANGALINMIMASRLVYGMSEEGIVPSFFGRVLQGRRTPITAIVFTTVLGLILVSTGDLGDLADTTVLLLLVAFTMVNISVLVLRKDKVDHDHFHAPVIAPVLAGIASRRPDRRQRAPRSSSGRGSCSRSAWSSGSSPTPAAIAPASTRSSRADHGRIPRSATRA